MEVSKEGHEINVFRVDYPVLEMILVDRKQVKKHMQFQRHIIAPWKAHEAMGRNVFMGISPSLIYTVSNRMHLVEIPYTKSSDFVGDLGKAVIESNWYDF